MDEVARLPYATGVEMEDRARAAAVCGEGGAGDESGDRSAAHTTYILSILLYNIP